MMTESEIWDRLGTVPDPEVPNLSIVDLGMVVSVRHDPLEVVLRPTFVGCPALSWIADQVKHALGPVDVRYDMTHPWSSQEISAEGRHKILEFGIAPPKNDKGPVACPFCASDKTRRMSQFGSALCRASYYCDQCHQPFEAWKPL